MPFNLSMWGAPNGDVAYSGMQHTDAQTNLLNLEAQAYPSKVEAQNSLSAVHRASASEMLLKQENERQMTEVMKELSTSDPKGPDGQPIPKSPAELAARFDRAAQVAMGSGRTQAGIKLADEGRKVRDGMARVEDRESLAALHKSQQQTIAAEQVADFTAGIDPEDPKSWNVAAQSWVANNPGKPIPSVFQRFDPTEIKQTQIRSKVFLEQQKIKQKDVEDQIKQAETDRKSLYNDESIAIRTAAEKRHQEKVDLDAKSGGGKVVEIKEPPKELMNQAEALIEKDFPGLPADAKGTSLLVRPRSQAVYDVASRAMEIWTPNRGTMSKNEALHEAYAQATKEGWFTKEAAPKRKFFGSNIEIPGTVGEPTSKYNRGGRDAPMPDTPPAPLPSSPAELKVNQPYVNKKGTVGYWDGKTMQLGAPPKKAGPSTVAPKAKAPVTADATYNSGG